jgi:hypothetical protein
MSTSFWYTHLRVLGRGWLPVWSRAQDVARAELDEAGTEVWGLFAGLIGLPSNELVAITHGPSGGVPPRFSALEAEILDQREMAPTARPIEPFARLDRSGLYVLRTFHLAGPEHVDEIVQLSTGAWTTFEAADAWESEPVGLFVSAPVGRSVDRMLLVTWYDGFGSWERSREPDPEARDRFVRRHMLTNGTNAIATSLVTLD